MARPEKQGLDYFSMDVEKDNKIKFLKAKFGLVGFAMYVELLQFIYKEGYYIEFTDDNMLLFMSETGLKEEETRLMLEFMLSKDLFNKAIFERYNILTSSGIQKRFVEGTRKRKNICVENKIRIVGKNDHIELKDTLTELKSELTELKSEVSTQRKEKKRKENIDANADSVNLENSTISEAIEGGTDIGEQTYGNKDLSTFLNEVKAIYESVGVPYSNKNERKYGEHWFRNGAICNTKQIVLDKAGLSWQEYITLLLKQAKTIKYGNYIGKMTNLYGLRENKEAMQATFQKENAGYCFTFKDAYDKAMNIRDWDTACKIIVDFIKDNGGPDKYRNEYIKFKADHNNKDFTL